MLNSRGRGRRPRLSCAQKGQYVQLCTAVQFAVRETAHDKEGRGEEGDASVILILFRFRVFDVSL
jgi:hypothetical protein